jgi:predicted dithiol-disulfide oxidoreductase (DUF899 family)
MPLDDKEEAMENENVPHPPIASRVEWTGKRKELLAREKAHTREYDSINAERRRLPMVKVEKGYTFDGPNGKTTLKEAFEGRRQLIIYHFMFDPEWEKGCPGCTGLVDALGDLSMLNDRDTTYALVSRAPLAKLDAYKSAKGWDKTWYSSFDSDFNYDFHVTHDAAKVPMEYNYLDQEEWEAKRGKPMPPGEAPGISVFFQVDGDIYHTYSAFARGLEALTDSYRLLDITPYGRQEDFEDSPEGWPQKPTYG